MKKYLTLALVISAVSTPFAAIAADLTLSLSLGEGAEVTATRYSCSDGTDYAVRYVNSGVNNLALIEWNDQTMVFVNVVAASGARYVAGPYEWWSKGSEASFTNSMDEKAAFDCKAAD